MVGLAVLVTIVWTYAWSVSPAGRTRAAHRPPLPAALRDAVATADE